MGLSLIVDDGERWTIRLGTDMQHEMTSIEEVETFLLKHTEEGPYIVTVEYTPPVNFHRFGPSFPYSMFARLREKLAGTVGIELAEMVGYGGEVPWESEGSGLVPLLNHSDCDGDLSPEECERIAPALRVAAAALDGDPAVDDVLALADFFDTCAEAGAKALFR